MNAPKSRHFASMQQLRVIVDGPGEGAWNMALDEALLESANEAGVATLRFYLWEQPTLSLGYFQTLADREQHPASLPCPVVRRSSGGGAILHDRELTYSLAWPNMAGRPAGASELYDAAHETLVAALAEFGVTAALYRPDAGSCGSVRSTAGGPEPFLCFARRACGDVVSGGHKICGSAQRRRRSALLQHGSVLLSRSSHAPELLGIAETAGVSIAPDALRARWLPRLLDRLECRPQAGQPTALERERAGALQERRFGAAEFASRR